MLHVAQVRQALLSDDFFRVGRPALCRSTSTIAVPFGGVLYDGALSKKKGSQTEPHAGITIYGTRKNADVFAVFWVLSLGPRRRSGGAFTADDRRKKPKPSVVFTSAAVVMLVLWC